MSEPVQILLDSTHFMEIRNALRSRSVAWDALTRSSELSELDASIAKKLETLLIKNINGHDKELRNLRIDGTWIEPLIHLLSTSENSDSIKSVQNLISELLTSDKYTIAQDTIKYFQMNPDQLVKLYDISFKENDDLQTILISSFNIVSLLNQVQLVNVSLVEKLINNDRFISILQNTSQMDACYVCIRLVQELCTVKEYRSILWENNKRFIPTVFKIISKNLNSQKNYNSTNNNAYSSSQQERPIFVNTNTNNLGIQLQYYSLLLIWLLTFDTRIASDMEKQYLNNFLNLFQLIRITIKEKISRLCIAIILQCCSKEIKGHKTFIKDLILLGNGIPTLNSLSERKYSDEELRSDITTLKTLLEEEYKELTSFDEYLAEINSKLICWSPPHVDNSFWCDNIDRFKQDNWKLFKKLIELLIEFKDSNEPNDKIVIQVLLNDITHVIELLPEESVNILNKLNGKVVIMELLNHSDSRIKFEALKATQSVIGYTFK
ncbi:H(+)-transporting V1 sector ATPase subunit H PWA37_004360 [Arxiozyma heterogenica]|uniref:H(+)-transporting V1 sector ATPase subunit H n=1 Tax=Arxiozyma heterogenica TaxID=278026 RepID=UPI002EF767A4